VSRRASHDAFDSDPNQIATVQKEQIECEVRHPFAALAAVRPCVALAALMHRLALRAFFA
jgi:hypothetical protein